MRDDTATGLLLVLLLGLATTGSASERASGDDDLAVVKKAVAAEPTPSPKMASVGPRSTGDPKRPKAQAPPPTWLKVRIVESGAHKSRVIVNLPLAMVRALGDDLPADLGSSHLRLSEVLEALESGEPLVEVISADSTVRVWVE